MFELLKMRSTLIYEKFSFYIFIVRGKPVSLG